MKAVIPNLITPIVRNDGIAAQTMRAWMESVTGLFQDLESFAMLYFSGNATNTAFSGVDVPVPVNATWVADAGINFEISASGDTQYLSGSTRYFSVDAVVHAMATSGSHQTVTLHIALNGVAISGASSSGVVRNTEQTRFVIPWQLSLKKGDVISLLLANNTSTNAVLCDQGILRIR